jgi:hypothetical protein
VSVFKEQTLPNFIIKTRNAFPNFDELPEHARGALVSLVYNRGDSLNRIDDRRKEMVEIADYMQNKDSFSQSDLDYIAQKFVEMQRLWPNNAGLKQRRMDEADYLQHALDDVEKIVPPSNPTVPSFKQGDIAATYTGDDSEDKNFLTKFASSACLVTAIAYVVNSKGRSITPGDFAMECTINRSNFMLEALPGWVSYAGYPQEYDESEVKTLINAGETPIIRFGTSDTHFVVATRVDGNGVIYVMDPASGTEVRMSDAFKFGLQPSQIRVVKLNEQ